MFKYETLIVNDDHDDNNNHDLFQCVQSQSKFQFFLLLWAMSAIDVLWKWNANVCIGGENTLGIIIKIMWKNSKLLPFRMLNNRAHLVFILSRSATTIFTLQHVFNVFLFEYIFFSLCLHFLSRVRSSFHFFCFICLNPFECTSFPLNVLWNWKADLNFNHNNVNDRQQWQQQRRLRWLKQSEYAAYEVVGAVVLWINYKKLFHFSFWRVYFFSEC